MLSSILFLYTQTMMENTHTHTHSSNVQDEEGHEEEEKFASDHSLVDPHHPGLLRAHPMLHHVIGLVQVAERTARL